jgi:hypothetical protein
MYDENDVQKPFVSEEIKQADVTVPETVSKKEHAVVTTEEPVKNPVKKMKKKRTVDVESFSRAPLREKREVIVPVKKELKVKER